MSQKSFCCGLIQKSNSASRKPVNYLTKLHGRDPGATTSPEMIISSSCGRIHYPTLKPAASFRSSSPGGVRVDHGQLQLLCSSAHVLHHLHQADPLGCREEEENRRRLQRRWAAPQERAQVGFFTSANGAAVRQGGRGTGSRCSVTEAFPRSSRCSTWSR